MTDQARREFAERFADFFFHAVKASEAARTQQLIDAQAEVERLRGVLKLLDREIGTCTIQEIHLKRIIYDALAASQESAAPTDYCETDDVARHLRAEESAAPPEETPRAVLDKLVDAEVREGLYDRVTTREPEPKVNT